MTKILFINDYKIGGGAEQVVLQTIELLKSKYDISYFYGSETHKQPDDLLAYIYSKKYYSLLLEQLHHIKPDIIHIANYYHLLSPSILEAIRVYKQTNSIKVIMTTHDFHLLSPNSGFTYFSWWTNSLIKLKYNPTLLDIFTKKWDYRGLRYSIAKQLQWIYAYKIKKLDMVIDHLISPSIFLADFLKKKYTEKNITVIRNPIVHSSTMPHHHALPSSEHLQLIYVGRISSEKGLDIFLNKLAKIKTIKYTLTIVGNGEHLTALKRLISHSDIRDNIILKGRLPHQETLKEMQNKDILILPSIWYENAPLSLVEGALNSLKILTMNYGGMKEIADICQNHYLLDKHMTNLEKGLHHLKDMPFIDNSDKIHSIFFVQKYIDQLEKMYTYKV